jgi:hypothetical protein
VLKVAQKVLEEALQVGAVVALKATQVVDLALEVRTLVFKRSEFALCFVLSTLEERIRFDSRFSDETLLFCLARSDVVVVELLSHGEHGCCRRRVGVGSGL